MSRSRDDPGYLHPESGRMSVLVDRSFRRGSDIIEALAMGPKPLVGPISVGLGAFGQLNRDPLIRLTQSKCPKVLICGAPVETDKE